MTLQIKINKLPKSRVEIEGEIEAGAFESYFEKALKMLGENLELDGFRKGKIPREVMLSNIPEVRILEEMAQMAISENYPKIFGEQKLDIISRPEVSITKLARNNPLNFKILVETLPEFSLPDFKKIAKEAMEKMEEKEKSIEVTDEDIENTIMDIRKSRAKKIPMKDVVEQAESVSQEKEELPNWDDEFVRSLGPFENIADFTEKLKENLKLEKANLVREKTRLKIMEAIMDKTEIEIPEVLSLLEVEKILYRMESDITQMGLKFEEYLKHLNKTRDDLKKEFMPDAEKKAKLSLILNEISKVEKIEASPEDIEKEVAHILEHYKDADKERARVHAHNVLTNELIFQFLENQK